MSRLNIKKSNDEQTALAAHKPISDKQVERTCQRALKFLSALSRNGQIRRILDLAGYNAEEHQQGWGLTLGLLGYSAAAPESEETSPSSAAIAELDQWDGPNFARARAALEHKFPEQAAYVFAGLTAKSGPESIAVVQTFLDRVAALRTGSEPARKAFKAADKGAVELLARRRILDAKLDEHLRGLIASATTLAPAGKVVEAEPEDRQALASKLEAWLNDWRETARVLVTRRDYQIILGLAQRRASGSGEEVEEDDDGTDASAKDGAPIKPATAQPPADAVAEV